MLFSWIKGKAMPKRIKRAHAHHERIVNIDNRLEKAVETDEKSALDKQIDAELAEMKKRSATKKPE